MSSIEVAGTEIGGMEAKSLAVFALTKMAIAQVAISKFAAFISHAPTVGIIPALNLPITKRKAEYKGLMDGQQLMTINGKKLETMIIDGKIAINRAIPYSWDK